MWFKNLVIYRLQHCGISKAALERTLSESALQPCSGLNSQSRGWIPPKAGRGPFVHTLGRQLLVCLGVEKKLLPTTVIRQFVEARATEVEESQGYKPGRKQLRQIRQAVADELLPKAFAVRRKIHAWIDPVDGWLVINAASIARADELVEMLVKAQAGIALSPVRTKTSPSTAMTDWVLDDIPPAQFSVDHDCELQELGEERAIVRYVRHPLEAGEIGKHIKAGKRVTKLALTWNDRLAFVLHDTLQLKRVAPLDILTQQVEDNDPDDLFDSDFITMTGELKRLLPSLIDALGGEL